ncbi:probable Probable endonuclease LCL3 [Cephalotrichum gorgonifer]|uniref:Probable endonuclease LCL3 n=1 Tax=Cephalotrichum gorgonifer TaxID=2041049 RepID=A0AAE8SR54_9PEZI|nr:probable Probable endonuclease LCL3 [Cephalotrichum gorgonifer]
MAPWPFSLFSSNKKEESNASPWTAFLSADDPRQIILPTVLSTVGILGLVGFYTRFLRRIPGTAYVKPTSFRSRSLLGRVTSVGDGDGFHLYHTPGGRLAGWGWLRKVPSTRAGLKNQTIPIRIAGIDAPEGAHFGRPAQPFSAEALSFLTSYVLHRPVRAVIHRRDQYDRVVATVFVRRFPFLLRKDVGLEMLKRGLATTYEAKTGVEFGGKEAVYMRAQEKAKKRRVGMWGGKKLESPREYKNRMRADGVKPE